MRDPVPLEEFVRMTGATAERVIALREHGLLDPEHDGLFDDVDLLRWVDLQPYFDRGYTVEKLAAGIRDGSIEVMLREVLFGGSDLISVEAAAERTGFDVVQLRSLLAGLGISDAYMTERDLDLVEAMRLALDAGLPFEGIIETARTLGDSLRRIADAEVRLVHVHMHERLLASGVDERDINNEVFGIQELLAPLLNPMLVRLHDLHVRDAAIEDALLHLAPSRADAGAAVPGSVEVSIVFLDLESFTSLTEVEGDEAAMRVLARIEDIMRPLVLSHRGRVVKPTGDGFMLAFREASDAVRLTIELRDALAHPDLPAMRAGINTGTAIFRGSDYIGSTVNIASRVTGAAMGGQILLTATTLERMGSEAPPVEEVGVRLLRGVDEPLALYRPVVDDVLRDPVCGAMVPANGGVHLQDDGRELAFCSQTCLREYLAAH